MALPAAIEDGLRPSPLITWYQDGTTTPENLTGQRDGYDSCA